MSKHAHLYAFLPRVASTHLLPAMTWASLVAQALRQRVDGFVVALVSVVLAATLLPCRGDSASAFRVAGILAVGALFFLQGARLSRDAILRGMTHWRLHVAINATTFVLFPLLGLSLLAAFPHALPGPLLLGGLFVCALPSTVQSSIALTSIAGGNVPGAVCSATASNIAGIVLAPLLFGAMSNLHGGGVNLMGIWQVVLQLLVPFAFGHSLRPWLGAWAERNRAVLALTDRGSILLVVYTAFSAAVVHGIWRQFSPDLLATLALLMGLLLALVLLFTIFASRLLSFRHDDEAALVFCGSQKSLVSGVPIANAMFPAGAAGPILLPLMLYYPMQLLICAWLARRYANVEQRRLSDERPAAAALRSAGLLDEVDSVEPMAAFARSLVRAKLPPIDRKP
jgi:sodium/bile acid cotransporter 7